MTVSALVFCYVAAAAVGTLIGAVSYGAFHPGDTLVRKVFNAFTAFWSIGMILISTFALLVIMVASVANCVGLAVDGFNKGKCSTELYRWFLVTKEWQTGIGGGLGLLGIAWAAQYQAAVASVRDATRPKQPVTD